MIQIQKTENFYRAVKFGANKAHEKRMENKTSKSAVSAVENNQRRFTKPF